MEDECVFDYGLEDKKDEVKDNIENTAEVKVDIKSEEIAFDAFPTRFTYERKEYGRKEVKISKKSGQTRGYYRCPHFRQGCNAKVEIVSN